MHILNDTGRYFIYSNLVIEKKFKPKNYLFNFNADTGNCWLEDLESFKVPEKIYDVSSNLREMIKTAFNHYNKNQGVLLSGNKGQGKSLTGKLLCNEVNLPIIIINKPIPLSVNFIGFFNQIKQDYVLFVDEFEKLFKQGNSHSEKDVNGFHGQDIFLSFMDGVLTNEHKILFLLTANESVNEYFINRPSRIKFLHEYSELPEELFNMITDDLLDNKEFKNDLEANISLLNLNIDLLISIINDINLFNKPFSEFKEYYNYKFEEYKYEVYHIINGKEKLDGFFSSNRRIKPNDRYIHGMEVNNMVKFSKEEIMFNSYTWEEDKKGNDIKKELVVKLIPAKFVGMSKLAF